VHAKATIPGKTCFSEFFRARLQRPRVRILLGHLQAGAFITKFRKTFTREEMNDDLEIVPARHQDARDDSEYDEILPTSPP